MTISHTFETLKTVANNCSLELFLKKFMNLVKLAIQDLTTLFTNFTLTI